MKGACQDGEINPKSLATADHHIVTMNPSEFWPGPAHRLAQAPADTVSFGRSADLLRHRKAEPQGGVFHLGLAMQQGHALPMHAPARGCPQKITAFLQDIQTEEGR